MGKWGCFMGKTGKRSKRWLRALEIAKVMFESEGYYTDYLEEIEAFIRGKGEENDMQTLQVSTFDPETKRIIQTG